MKEYKGFYLNEATTGKGFKFIEVLDKDKIALYEDGLYLHFANEDFAKKHIDKYLK